MAFRTDAARKEDSQEQAIARTMAFWQPRESICLNVEDARETIENVAGFFGLLAAWEADHRTAEVAAPLKNSNVTEISIVAHEATNEHESKQEDINCSPASNVLAA
jgi:hypothetical protein